MLGTVWLVVLVGVRLSRRHGRAGVLAPNALVPRLWSVAELCVMGQVILVLLATGALLVQADVSVRRRDLPRSLRRLSFRRIRLWRTLGAVRLGR